MLHKYERSAWSSTVESNSALCGLQLTTLMEKREDVHTEILKTEQHALKIAAEAAFVVSPGPACGRLCHKVTFLGPIALT